MKKQYLLLYFLFYSILLYASLAVYNDTIINDSNRTYGYEISYLFPHDHKKSATGKVKAKKGKFHSKYADKEIGITKPNWGAKGKKYKWRNKGSWELKIKTATHDCANNSHKPHLKCTITGPGTVHWAPLKGGEKPKIINGTGRDVFNAVVHWYASKNDKTDIEELGDKKDKDSKDRIFHVETSQEIPKRTIGYVHFELDEFHFNTTKNIHGV